jgi:HSP20 family molecular chaperone IbpA
MPPTRFIDEIDRLFNELVRDPWRSPRRGSPAAGSDRTDLEVAIPVEEHQAQDVCVAIEGDQLIVIVRHDQNERAVVGAARVATGVEKSYRRSFAVPPGATLAAVETRLEPGALRIRVQMRVAR